MQSDTANGGRTNGTEDFDGPVTTVVTEVAREKDVDPLELAPLYDVVDTDAICALVAHDSDDVEVRFEYEGCRVIVRGDGRVRVNS